MSFLKRKDPFDAEAAWRGAQKVSEQALALFILGTRYQKEIHFRNDHGIEFHIKNMEHYAELVREVKNGWRRTLRSSEYIRTGDKVTDMWVQNFGRVALRLEYAVDNNSSQPYIIEVAMVPVELNQNSSNFRLQQISGHMPGNYPDCELHFSPQPPETITNVLDWNPNNWDGKPYTVEQCLGRFPYK